MAVGFLLLCIYICVQITIAESNTVTIKDGASLKKYLCGNSLPPNTQLLLDEPELRIAEEESEFCLLENTTNISITASERVLEMGHWYVNVSCAGSGTETFGFGFFNVTNLTIRSVLFDNCKAHLSLDAMKFANESSQFLYYSDALLVPLLFNHCCNLKLHDVFVSHSLDSLIMGIVGINICGKSEVISMANESMSHPLLSIFLHFADSNVSSILDCNLTVTSNIISSRTEYWSPNKNYFSVGAEQMPVENYYSDLAVFMTQSFLVDVSINIKIKGLIGLLPMSVIVGFINSMNTSHIVFQGYYYKFNCFPEHVYSYPRSFMLTAVFYETPSFRGNKTENVLSSLLIKNTSFSFLTESIVVSHLGSMLQILQFTRRFSHQVVLKDVSWRCNILDKCIDFQSFHFLHVQNVYQNAAQLYLNISGLIVQKNLFACSPKSSNCLLCFENLAEISMIGTNYLVGNYGGSVISVTSSKLSVSGNLTISSGYALEGGGIRLDSMSTLFLTEPLEAHFSNNLADRGSAIYAPKKIYAAGKASSIQIVPRYKYSLANVSSINIWIHFTNNSNGQFEVSFYAPHFSIFGNQTSPNLLFKRPSHEFALESDSWDFENSQFAYTTLIDTILFMNMTDKFTSLANGLCMQQKWQKWECMYIDQNIISAILDTTPLCLYKVPYLNVYPGQKAFSVRYISHQVYSFGTCNAVTKFFQGPYKYINSSFFRDNSTLTYTINYIEQSHPSDTYIILFSDAEVNINSVPILQARNYSCPIGFCLVNGACDCDEVLQTHEYNCNIDDQSLTGPTGYWTGFNNVTTIIMFSENCPPRYCIEWSHHLYLYQDPALSCLGSRTGDLCGECKDNHSTVFGSDDCHDHCTNWYLLTVPVYVLAGVLLVLLLFVLRLTVATGTINGLIFYANMLGLVMDRLTENISSHYVAFMRVWISLLNLDLGFPLCFYEGMTTAAKVGLQFLFPTYLWGIIIVLIVLSKFSSQVTKLVSNSSVQVLTTLFFLSFSKLLRTVIVIFSHSLIHTIMDCDYHEVTHVWFYDGKEYGGGAHAFLLILAAAYTLLFLLPYALLVTFSSCFVRFGVVNKFRPFIEAYGGPFKDKWRFWFGLRLWITILLFGLDGALEGTNSNTMFIVQSFVIMVFLLVQVFIRPFKNSLIGLFDASFMFNYWLIVQIHIYFTFFKFDKLYFGVYICLTVVAALVTFLILLLHMCALKYPDTVADIIGRCERKGYEVINEGGNEPDSDVDLFQAAEERVVDTY